jgi:iron(III) transport system permease protein
MAHRLSGVEVTTVRSSACLLGGLILLATTTVVPFLSRQGQVLPIGRADLALTPLALASQYPGFWLLIGLAVAWVALGLLRQDRPDRSALWGGLIGCFLVIWLTVTAGVKPYAFGLGSILALTICLLVLAYGLSRGGYIRADTFVAASILLLGFFVLLFINYPILVVLQHSVVDTRGGFQPGLFLETLRRYKSFWRVLGNSLGLAVFVGVASTLIGLAFALAATRSRSRLTVLLRPFSLLPMITPPFVVGLAIILLFGLQGLVTSVLLGLKTRGIFGFPGVALAQTLSFAPVAFLVIASVVESVNPALEEASLTLRAGPWGTFWRVTLPLLRPGVANAFLLTIVESLADFGNPIILGGEFEVLSTEV